jgi:hypothetical protein
VVERKTAGMDVPPKAKAAALTKAAAEAKTVAERKKAVSTRREAIEARITQHVCLCCTKCVGVCVNAPLPEGSSRKRQKKQPSDE